MPIRFRILLAAFLLGLATGACTPTSTLARTSPSTAVPAAPSSAAPPATPAPLQTVRLCYSSKSSTQIVAWYAFENGLFQKYGLKPEIVSITGGANGAAALLAQEQDFCQGAAGSVANAVAAGQDLVEIAGLYEKFLFALLVDPKIQKPEDLIGQSIAVGNARGSRETGIRLALPMLGLQPDTQVKLVPFKDLVDSAMVASVESGQVAGAVLAIPVSAKFQEQGLHILVDLSTMDIFYQSLGLMTTRSYVLAHRDITLAVLKATIEAIARMKHDPEGTMAVLAKYQALDPVTDAATLSDAYAVIQKFLSAVPYPSEAGMQAVLDEAVSANPDIANVKVDQLIDWSLVRELDESGFIASLTP